MYTPSNVIANTLKLALAGRDKLLLTATPLQNSLLELFGLVSFIDEHAFGDVRSVGVAIAPDAKKTVPSRCLPVLPAVARMGGNLQNEQSRLALRPRSLSCRSQIAFMPPCQPAR